MEKSITHNSRETQRLAAKLTKRILFNKRHLSCATVIGLIGDLGAGKTTFIQGFAKALGVKQRLISPTFLIMRSYALDAADYALLYHIDTYRLRKPAELLSLGFKTILKDSKNIIIIEWADKIKKFLPKNTYWITFFHGRLPSSRKIIFDQKKPLAIDAKG
ncbi:MAG: tRNA (adenosine(37)-N6)-threonylcarbamoyltransferase complex ATPase subunit type 1 TsaE [bacterium]|nr:tRNA (adenosine(37)-N6)-threonylcarbamoyltransferase complex ATPase subunit type 1 TsaE [bacterium]